MDSGAHTVQDVICSVCNTTLGWKFVKAHEWPEKWKEGNIVLELELLEEEYSGSPLKQEISPLSDETNVAKRLLVPGIDPAHRRSTSDLSERRVKPLGPRNHKSMQVLNTMRNIIHAHV
ncbi:hypothetical protein QCA50_011944 [Cerrena zonata]|uniref:Yippee domain-containing protein n=1 Tax=Cerrena zonata TaxID=2478898 RepID=A0AAW0G7Y0_9APHY